MRGVITMIKATIETIEQCFDVEVLACRIDDDYLLVRDIDTNRLVPRECLPFWVTPDVVIFNY